MQFLNNFAAVCSLYNNIKPPSWVASGADFHLFKKGIEPKWEDPRCENGGKWTVLVPKGPSGKQTMDTYWLNAVCDLSKMFSTMLIANNMAHRHRLAIRTGCCYLVSCDLNLTTTSTLLR